MAPTGDIFSASNQNAGWEFKVNAKGVRVTEVGCVTYDGNPRVISIFDSATKQVVARATTPGAGTFSWRWVKLDKPILLKKDRKYLVAQFTAAYNYFLRNDLNSYPTMRPTGDIEFVRSLVGGGSADSWPGNDMGGYVLHGITDIGYELVPAVEITADPGVQKIVYPADQGPGGHGVVAGGFTIRAVGQPQPALVSSVTIAASGSGDDAADFSNVALYRDSNANGAYDPGVDVSIGGAASAFPTDNGALTFNFGGAEATFGPADLRKYLLVVRLSGNAEFDDTFKFTVTELATDPGTAADGAPTPAMEGLKATHQPIDVVDHEIAQQTALAREVEYVVQDFTLRLALGANRKVMDLTFEASGSGDDSADFTSVRLFRDSDRNGVYDAGDALIGEFDAFWVDNGVLRFDFDPNEPELRVLESARFFLVVKLALSAPHGATYRTRLVAATERYVGCDFLPVPSPAAGPTPGLVGRNHNLVASLNGPLAPETVANNSLGPDRKGHVLCDVTVQAFGAAWSLNELKFRASGNGDDSAAFASLMLIEDYNQTGAYEGLPQDEVATTGASPGAFAEDNGLYIAPLANTYFAPGVPRRFFLVVMFLGTARAGDDFNAALEAVTGPAPQDGLFVPSDASLGPVIDLPTLVAGLGSGSPGDSTRETGADFSYVIAKFRFTASGAPASLNALQLTNRGTAYPNTDLRGGDGVELWLDDGNGLFDEAADARLCAVTGFAPVTPCPLDTPVEIAAGVTRDLWVRVNVLASAGGSIADTFQFALEHPADIDAGNARVMLASTPPVSGTLSVVQFSVDELSPQVGAPNGGEEVVVRGTGFALPVKLYIGGVLCPGLAQVSADGRQITGLYTPSGNGRNLEVRLKTGGLEEKTLPMAFSYRAGGAITSFDHTDTCAAGAGGLPWLAALPLLWLALRRRRRMRA